ncbi:MAG: TonB-dependent receptor plug domain-containing protein [Bacteroidales bacterium]|nr:TonB-dependent receptor plug domain-containing protein [Bacteroidales bacterium]
MIDHFLQQVTQVLGGVTVVERRRTNTDVSIISSIKQSNLIVSGISSQQIQRSQDKDASEVIRRVPGITIMDNRFVVVRGLIERYNSVWLNNSSTPSTETDQRAFSFDVIPSNLINNILVYKTPAPELPADFAGAAIQIFTKNLPEKNNISFGYSATYNQGTTFKDFEKYKGSKTDWLGFDNGMRSLPGNIPSTEEMIQIQSYNSGTLEEQAAKKARMLEIAKSFSTVSSTSQIKAPFDNRFNVDISRLFNLKTIKVGNITALSYKTSYDSERIERSSVESYGTTNEGVTYSKNYSDDQYSHSIEIGGLHNWSVSFGKNIIEFRNLLNQKGKSTTTIRNGLDHYRDDNKIFKTQLGYVSKTIYSGNLGGEHKFGDDVSTFTWNAGYSYANRVEPDVILITYYSTKTSDTSYYPNQLEYSFNPNSDANARLFSRVQEHIVNLNLNYNHKIEIGNFTPEIKIGSFIENRKRDFYIRPFGIVWAKPGVFNQTILMQPIDSVYNISNFNFTDGVMYKEVYNSRYRYKANNSLVAGYISFKIPVTSFINVYAGVRAEKYHLVLSGFQSKNDSLTPNITSDTLNFFPSDSMTINLSKKVLFRLAYGKTINRPEFREMAPFAFMISRKMWWFMETIRSNPVI